MLFDTHCHLDAAEFDADRDAVVARAQAAGVHGILIPAVDPANFVRVRELAHGIPGGAYALGIHPMAVAQCEDDALAVLRAAILDHLDDPRFVAVGEIGLDFFDPEISLMLSCNWPLNLPCPCSCMCGERRTPFSSTCAVDAWAAALRTLSMAVCSRPRRSLAWASRWASGAP